MLKSFNQFSVYPPLVEVSANSFNLIADKLNVKPEEMPLNNMFKGQLRVAIPLHANKIAELQDVLEKSGFAVNFANGTVSKQVTTKVGPKEQKLRIGRAIEMLVKGKVIAPKWVDYWNKHSEHALKELKKNPEFLNKEDDYSIIISRSPVDLLRMSDFEGLKSCHREGGDYFHCAIKEAKTGGAIAYVVHTKDLAKVNLNDKEIFRDNSRNVQGISPISRVRLRLFKNNNMELGLPELRIYGEKIPGFRDNVKEWAQESLQDTLNGERPDMNDFTLFGGSYKDNVSSMLFNDFFDDDKDDGDVDTDDNEDEDDQNEARRTEIESFERRYNNFEHIHASYYESDELQNGQNYFHFDASFVFEFPARLINKEKIEKYAIRNLIVKYFNNSSSYSINDFHYEERNGKGSVYCRIDPNTSYGSPDEYKDFLQELKDADNRYWEMYAYMRKTLLDYDVLRPDAKDKLIQYAEDEKYQHFGFASHPYDNNDKELDLASNAIPLFTYRQLLTILNKQDSQFNNESFKGKEKQIVEMVRKSFMTLWTKMKAGYDQQPLLPGFYKPNFPNPLKKTIDPVLELRWNGYSSDSNRTLNLTIRFDINWETDNLTIYKVLRTIHLLDNNLEKTIDQVRDATVRSLSV